MYVCFSYAQLQMERKISTPKPKRTKTKNKTENKTGEQKSVTKQSITYTSYLSFLYTNYP